MPTVEKQNSGRRDSLRLASTGPLSASTSARPLTIRTRLNSLRSVSSPQKVTSSSVLTLQGPKRGFPPLRLLSPTSSRPSPSSPSSGADGGSEGEEEEEEELRKLEEEERRIEEQDALERKLKDLELKMTRDAVGLVSSPTRLPSGRRGGRDRPLSESSTSSSIHHRLAMSRRHSLSQTPSHHSLSSTTNSTQGSIPDIPSPPLEFTSQPTSPITRHLNTAISSRSPPTVSHNTAFGTMRGSTAASRRLGGNVRSDKGSEIGSTASSLSDLSGKGIVRTRFISSLITFISDASLSSAMDSSLMSNVRGQSSRLYACLASSAL